MDTILAVIILEKKGAHANRFLNKPKMPIEIPKGQMKNSGLNNACKGNKRGATYIW
jgi:hypothetical protein